MIGTLQNGIYVSSTITEALKTMGDDYKALKYPRNGSEVIFATHRDNQQC